MDYLKNLPNYIHELLNKVAQENAFKNFTLEIDQGSNPGDGFGGEILSVAILERESDKKLDLVCKIAPFSRNRRIEMCSSIFFKNEALWYDRLMPILEKFQTEKNLSPDDQFRCSPKCYATLIDDENERYVIILEDLRPSKFRMWDKVKLAPIENLRMTLRELGKLHGLSYAFKDQRPAEFEEFKQPQNGRLKMMDSERVKQMTADNIGATMNSLKKDEHKNIARYLAKNMYRCLNEFQESGASRGFGTLCHGDCWNNNIMYRFDEQGHATDIRFLDWQMVAYTSPTIDLAYYLFSSTDQALRDAEYDNLLAFYHETLAKTIKLLGSDPDKLFSMDDLQNELKKCGEFAMLIAPIGVMISQTDSSHALELNELFENGNENAKLEFLAALSEEGQRVYDRRLNEIYEDVIKRGYFTPNKLEN